MSATPRGGWAVAAGLLITASGASMTVAGGAVVAAAGLLGLIHTAPWASLLVACAGALSVGQALAMPGLHALAAAAALGLQLVATPAAPASKAAWRVPWGISLTTAVAAAVLLLTPLMLPLPGIVRPRPLPVTVMVVAVVWVTALALPALQRRLSSRAWSVGLIVAGLVPVVRAGLLWAMPSTTDPVVLSARAGLARDLGLREQSANLLAASCVLARDRNDPRFILTTLDEGVADADPARRHPTVLWLTGWAMAQSGAPPSDVDATLQRALGRAGSLSALPDLDGWPGRQSALFTAMRARSPLARELGADLPPWPAGDVLDCFGGSLCLLRADLPATTPSQAAVPAVLTFQVLAPAVGPVTARLDITWQDWSASALLDTTGGAQGSVVRLEVPVDMRQPRPGTHQVWLSLWPTDGGAPLRLGRRPGAQLMVGQMGPSP